MDLSIFAASGDSDEEKPKKKKKSLSELATPDAEEVLDMAIDAAMNYGCGDPEMRREHFKRAVCMLIEQYMK